MIVHEDMKESTVIVKRQRPSLGDREAGGQG